ncbi:MAG: polysaccharide deacetylase family protein [Deltaproteobacteria bacterium]|nr:polysaccharide deacetylase family protein [Deltaproteobacteria bacterium]MCL5278233.1 polysaccharide deacetylase family protein [Deltaproteobacteria bacterium]
MGKTDPVARPRATLFPLSPAVLAGIGAFQLAAVLFFVSPYLAAAPLALFIVLCLIAPFFPRLRLFMPVIARGSKQKHAVALTFDDGPSPETTPLLLGLLEKHGVRAAHFVIGAKAALYPDLIKDILSRGHELGNHTMSHDVFLMLKSSGTLGQEIDECQGVLARYGVRLLMFRPPVGIVNPGLWRELLGRGLSCMVFSRRARDFGNRRIRGIAARVLKKVKAGDIIVLHDCAPKNKGMIDLWLKEVERVITGVREKGLGIVPLSELINRPVMVSIDEGNGLNPATAFYDGIASSYDDEQKMPLIAVSRRAEHASVMHKLDGLIRPTDRVLEIGPGTGMYTMALARRAKDVVAVDVSGSMLKVLEHKAEQEHLANIKYVRGDIREISMDGRFNHICAFSSLEYVPDLADTVVTLARHLEPGGTFYFTTAHRTFFRFWTQIGNAMRQGMWLHARSIREIRTILSQAGLAPVVMETHGLNLGFNTGMLLEVMAKKP